MSNPPHTPPPASLDGQEPGQDPGQDPGTVALTREYRFEAAHMLPRVPDGHRCKRLHGHSYKVEVTVAGPVDEDSGWLIDFYDLDRAVVPHIEALDHRTLNDLPGLDNPTCERLCDWLWRRLAPSLPQLAVITVWETTDARCSYYGPRNAAGYGPRNAAGYGPRNAADYGPRNAEGHGPRTAKGIGHGR